MIFRGLRRSETARIVLIYFSASFLYIALSDAILSLIIRNETVFAEISIYKGWVYTVIMSVVIAFLLYPRERQTERLLARLGNERSQLLMLSDNFADPVVLYDGNGRIETTNRVFVERFGAGKSVAVRKNEDLFGRRNGLRVNALIQQAIMLRKAQRTEITVAGSGQDPPFVYDATAIPMRHDKTGSYAVIVSLHDITRLKRECRLQGELFSLASSRLTDYAASDPVKFAKLLSDIVSLNPADPLKRSEKTTVAAQIADAVKSMKQVTDRSRLTIVTEIGRNLPDLPVDETKFRTAVTNVYCYAGMAAPKGSQITVTADSSRNMITVNVLSEGPGIPFAEQSRVFEPFFCPSTFNGCRDITGLEIYTARVLARSWGGELTVSSVPDNGMTFHLFVPLI